MRVFALIPAAGIGTRMKTGGNKQFAEIGGMPMLSCTVMAFQKCSMIDCIIISAKQEDIPFIKSDIVARYGLDKVHAVVPGGEMRQDSVYSGLKAIGKGTLADVNGSTETAAIMKTRSGFESASQPLSRSVSQPLSRSASQSASQSGVEAEAGFPAQRDDIVLIHDGARPLVNEETILRCTEAVIAFGAACTAVPMNNTVKTADADGFIVQTLDRELLWSIQTPQGFRFGLISDCYAKAVGEGFYGTDDSILVERTGFKVKLVMGTYENIKVTTQEDLLIANSIISRRLDYKFS